MAGKPGRSGGARPGAGRKPKAPVLIEEKIPNGDGVKKDEPEVVEVVLASDGRDPIEFLEAVMLHSGIDAKLRIDAAKALLPYKHARKGEGGKKEERASAAKKAASKFATTVPPKLVVNNRQ